MAYVLIPLIAIFVGGLFGSFVNRPVGFLVLGCALLSLILQGLSIFFFGPEIENFSFHYLIGYSFYLVEAYLVFFLAPVLIGGGLMYHLKSRRVRKEKRSQGIRDKP